MNKKGREALAKRTHTPGCKEGWRITDCQECERLIAAAPELLEACKRILWWIDQEKVPYLMDTDDNPGEAIRKAIAKAEGK